MAPSAGKRNRSGDANVSTTGNEPTARDSSYQTPSVTARVNKELEEMDIDSGTVLFTPRSVSYSNPMLGTVGFSRPLTRSARHVYFDSILVGSPSTEAPNRLGIATIKGRGPATGTTSRLEDSQDIRYEPAEDDGEKTHEQDRATVDEDDNEDPSAEPDDEYHPRTGGSRRRSGRIRAKTGIKRQRSPSATTSDASRNDNRAHKRQKKTSAKSRVVTGPLRRSARLAKPLDVFYKYPDLPAELKLMIWEEAAAAEPRLTYICNRASLLSHAHRFGIQNKLPSWFMTCPMSVYIAKRCYQKMFAHVNISPHQPLRVKHQDINPFVDIVVYEPCHNGCRAYWCAQQYHKEDRAAVQRLAVQMDSPNLSIYSEPGWVSVSKSWPNVKNLFMMKGAIMGQDNSDKAMLRIKEGAHEMALRKLFDEWKKGAGKDHKLTTIEFVRVVQKEAEKVPKSTKDRYQSIDDRKTGLAEDIILG